MRGEYYLSMLMMKPAMMIGSRPFLAVAGTNPNRAPPVTSPTAMKIEQIVARAFLKYYEP